MYLPVLGVVLARLPDCKKETFLITLSQHDKIIAIDDSVNKESLATMINSNNDNKKDDFVD